MLSRTTRHTRHLTLPIFAPFTSVFLALNCLFQLTYCPATPRLGVVALHETPRVQCQVCFNVPDDTRVIVSLAADGHTSFAISNAGLQAVVLQRVIGINKRRFSGFPAPKWAVLPDQQLAACVVAAQTLSPRLTALPVNIYLMADAQTNSSAVMQLLNLLRQQGINRLNLIAHCRT